jgi:hypothetical protein
LICLASEASLCFLFFFFPSTISTCSWLNLHLAPRQHLPHLCSWQ